MNILKDIKGTIRCPIRTFKEISEREINLKRPIGIILILGVLTAITAFITLTKTMFEIPEEIKSVIFITYGIGVIFTFIGVFGTLGGFYRNWSSIRIRSFCRTRQIQKTIRIDWLCALATIVCDNDKLIHRLIFLA